MAHHEIPLERRTLHGHFSRDLEPILTIKPGDSIAFACLDSGWNVERGRKFEPRDETLDAGHALVGPVAVRGARVLELMGRELGLERREALAFASVVADLRMTQLVNGAKGVHTVLPTAPSAPRQ